MEKNSIVQIVSKGKLDKCFNGCIGFIESINNSNAKVAIYHPKEIGKNAFVQKIDVPLDNLLFIGTAKLKPL